MATQAPERPLVAPVRGSLRAHLRFDREEITRLVGILGVVVALHPSPDTISLGTVCALTGSFSYAMFLVATRKLAGTPATVLITGQLLAALLFGGVLVLSQGWTAPGDLDLLLMLLLGIGSLAGNLCVNQSLRIAPASVVVPFQYTLILWGMIFGYLFFGEVVGLLTMIGAGIIVGAGLFIFLRERQLRGRDPDHGKSVSSGRGR